MFERITIVGWRYKKGLLSFREVAFFVVMIPCIGFLAHEMLYTKMCTT